MNNVLNGLTGFLTQFKGVQASDYCHLDTAPDNESDCLLMTHGGYISGLNLEGLNKLVGEEESADAHAIVSRMIKFLIINGHEIDWGFSQNGLESSKELNNFFEPMKNTSEIVGLDLEQDLENNKKALLPYTRPEKNIIYIITKPKTKEINKEALAELKNVSTEYMNLFKEHKPGQSFLNVVAQSTALKNEHEAAVETCISMLLSGGYTVERITRNNLPKGVKEDCEYESTSDWKAWLWGDKARYKFTPEDEYKGVSGLINWGGPSLGLQLHPNDIEPISNGILKVGDYYVAPLLIEMLPDNNNWITELLREIPNNLPFRYRAYIKGEKAAMHTVASVLSKISNFSRKYLRTNALISDSFDYIEGLQEQQEHSATISITMCTWGKSKSLVESNLSTLEAKLSAWGQTQALKERGDPLEAVIATIPGYSNTLFAPSTLESIDEITKLVPHTRPASPFDDGFSPLRTIQGKLWPISPASRNLPAYIELVLAGSGSGKSVYQNAVNRDSNLKPGNRTLSKHVTLDIGPSGKGTVKRIKGALPPNRSHEAIYEKMSLSVKHAFNPFDLQLGARYPTAVDRGFLQDFIELLATPKNYDKPSPLMAEMITEIIDAAYERAFDKETAKLYRPGENHEVDEKLALYPEAIDPETQLDLWGRRKTWIKVRDYLFDKGHTREAIVAQRYVVPLVTELSSVLNQTPNIANRYKEAAPSGIPLVSEFQTLMSAAAKNFPLLTQPTAVDFDSSSYIVFDLNDVSQQEGSQQTNVMYSLTAQLGTRNYWFNEEDLPIFEDRYLDYNERKIEEYKEASLGVTFEEFRRTKGSPKLRSMINRWMAEGRKWGVRVQIVMQQPEHADEEMFGHATLVTIMGTWNHTSMKQLEKKVELTESERYALTSGVVHGPRPGGSSMLIKYQLKDKGWGSQVVYLTKSVSELWSSSTTNEDVILKEQVEELVGGDSDMANDILCTRFKKGSAVLEIQEMKKQAKLNEADSENIYIKLAKAALQKWQVVNGKRAA